MTLVDIKKIIRTPTILSQLESKSGAGRTLLIDDKPEITSRGEFRVEKYKVYTLGGDGPIATVSRSKRDGIVKGYFVE